MREIPQGLEVLPGGNTALIQTWAITEWAPPWNAELPDGVNIELLMHVIDGVPHAMRVDLVSTRSDRGVPPMALRDIRLEDWIERACTVVAVKYEQGAREFSHAEPGESLPAIRRARARARGGYTDDMMRQVADVYMSANVHPTKAVREAFGVAQSTAQLYVKKARERTDPETGEPFLGAATRGNSGEQS
jgi:hypothetical protein